MNASDAGGEPFPLSDLQAAYMVGSTPLMELGGFHPNLYLELDLVGFDPARAEHAVRLLIARHEQLRTVMSADGTQRVLSADELPPFRLAVTDLAGSSPAEVERALRRTRERMAEQGPAPTGWPLFEILAHRVRPHRVRLHLAMSLLLLDSAGTRLLQREWLRLYHDPEAELPPVTSTFRSCLRQQAEAEAGEEHRRQWAYWQDRLDTLPEAPRLPLAVRPAEIRPVRLTRRSHRLGRAQWQRLRAVFRAHRILPTTALLHVYAETLGTWAATPRFCLNVLHQNWTNRHPEAHGVVGQFSATLPLEVDLGQDGEGFWERAARLQRRLWKDLEHSDVTGVRITRELGARRGWTSRAALPYVFNSMLGPATPERGRTPSGLVCREVTTVLRTPQVLIDNQIKDAPDGGVECVWDVVDEAFPPGLPDTMFAAYARMLDALAAGDDLPDGPDPLPEGHRETVRALNTWPGTPPEGRLEDGFLRRAARAPEAPAVLTSRRVVTYGELEGRSRAVAVRLRELGVGPGDVVPVVMSKGWEQVVAVLGVLRAGAAYCPVDAALPAERVAHLLDACAARAVLGRSRWPVPAAVERDVPVVPVDLLRPAGEDEPLPPAGRGPDDLAYVIYTSGSTGAPKGVMIEHRAALNTVADINHRTRLAYSDRVFGISSLSFDLSVWDVFGTLAAGAALVLPDPSAHPDPEHWARLAARHGVTVWNSVPALAEMYAEITVRRGLAPAPVRAFLLSGDWVPLSLPGRLRASWPGCRVLAMGGATEASIWSNLYEVGDVDPAWRSVPYGTALTHQTMTVLDHRMELRAPWAPGRIHIGGVGLARGYAGDERRTAERFVRHPVTGERLYWTGDLGRYLPDGTIEFLGREDRQLKIQGFRVEPGEVEAAIRSHPRVADCAVGAVASADGRPRLVALVVPEAGAELDAGTVRGHLRGRLPSYMVPGQLEVVERLPLSANGKVDLSRALPRLAASPSARPQGDDPVTRRLGELWAELLQVPVPDAGGDFFRLGGNSLLALRLMDLIRTELGVDLGFGQLFEAPTLGELAEVVRSGGPAGGCAVTLPGGGEGAADVPGLFLFHPVGGAVTAYLELARAWPAATVAFQSRALVDGSADALAPDLTAMARAYAAELRGMAPEGPLVLGGWSMGGVLAHETARLLAEDGLRCAVFMIDSVPRERRAPADEAARHREFLADLAGGRIPAPAEAALRRAEAARLDEVGARVAVEQGLLPEGTDADGYARLMRVHAHNLAVLGAHTPAKSQAPTLLFVAADEPRACDPAEQWQSLCPVLEVVRLPGDHYSVVVPRRLRAVAGRVRDWLGSLED
ncbi:amino acid adenylation domain-containing protein [Streptomyces sp. NPDC053367]|uniref:amino acid adenylation domain-containing protein n=1 Tax=Streptomyces sp. NPDC053367 TaxID=3365700 RepID=UPI0037CCC93F